MHEFEHIHNSLIAPMGSGAKLEMRLQMIGQALDRVLRGQGQHEAAAALNGGQVKEKVKRHVEEPGMMAPSTARAGANGSGGGGEWWWCEARNGLAFEEEGRGPPVKSKGGISTSQKSGEPGRRVV